MIARKGSNILGVKKKEKGYEVDIHSQDGRPRLCLCLKCITKGPIGDGRNSYWFQIYLDPEQ